MSYKPRMTKQWANPFKKTWKMALDLDMKYFYESSVVIFYPNSHLS